MSRFELGENIGAEVVSEFCAAQSAAVDSQFANLDADLKAIVEQWDTLPDAVKAGIVAMVRVSSA